MLRACRNVGLLRACLEIKCVPPLEWRSKLQCMHFQGMPPSSSPSGPGSVHIPVPCPLHLATNHR